VLEVPVGKGVAGVESDNAAVEPCTWLPVTRLMEYDVKLSIAPVVPLTVA
jgi:hypothetical protein